MPTYVSYQGEGDFAKAPEGLHAAVCVDVVDMPEQKDNFNPGETVDKVRLVWEIDEDHPKFDGNFTVSGFYRKSLHPKSNLRKTLENWRGRAFTDEELTKFDLDTLVGVPCQVQVIHSDNGYANVSAVVAAGKGAKLKPSGHYVRVKDRDDSGTDEKGAANATAKEYTDNFASDDDELPF